MKNIEVVELVVQSLPGANQGESTKECMKRAVGRWQNVHLRHNWRSYDIRPNDLLGASVNAPKFHGTQCLACGVSKAAGTQEVYPYPADDYFDEDPIPALFELDCQSTEVSSEFRVVTVCHECFHKLLPGMWISSDMWQSLNPITTFEKLPLLETSNGTTGQIQ